MLDRTRMLVVTAALAAVTPSMAHAQKLGQGGTGVDETTAVPQCQVPLGVAALVEEKAAKDGGKKRYGQYACDRFRHI